MKIIIENSVYVIIMVLICLVGIDFILMNISISHVNEIEQYIEDYIEIYGEANADGTLSDNTFAAVRSIAGDNGMKFEYEYESETEKYVYYTIYLRYTLRSKVFRLGKSSTYNGIVRVETGR
ncbi:MAG: hypothetical protein Q4F11_07905 [Eubacteriales bacterium]|nr:hypothetical protein [Eubacteriales bacterium]